jgi:hypothetical protein
LKINDVSVTKNSCNAVVAAAVPKHKEAAPMQPKLAFAISGRRAAHVPAAAIALGRLATRPKTEENEKVKDGRKADRNLDNVKPHHDPEVVKKMTTILVVGRKTVTRIVVTLDLVALQMEVVGKPLLINLSEVLPLPELKTPKFAIIISKANVQMARNAAYGIRRNAASSQEELAPLATDVTLFTGANLQCLPKKTDPGRTLQILRRAVVQRRKRRRTRTKTRRSVASPRKRDTAPHVLQLGFWPLLAFLLALSHKWKVVSLFPTKHSMLKSTFQIIIHIVLKTKRNCQVMALVMISVVYVA